MNTSQSPFSQENYQHAIDKDTITSYLASDEVEHKRKEVDRLQKMKENYAKKILIGSFWGEKNQQHDHKENDTEKKETRKDSDYLRQFEEAVYLSEQYLHIPQRKLEQALHSRKFSLQEQQKIRDFIAIENKANSLINADKHMGISKEILFDRSVALMYQNDPKEMENIPCFYEEDKQGIQKFFSLNDLMNDIQTFGIERSYPFVRTAHMKTIQEFFPHFPRLLRYHKLRKFIEKHRDKQERIIYDFPHYTQDTFIEDKQYTKRIEWKIAEQVVEWMFRHFAQLSKWYEIKINKASIGEDIANKIDFVIEIKDVKTGVSVEKQLQLTISKNDEYLEKKQKQLQSIKEEKGLDVNLISLMFEDLQQKFKLWRAFGAPTWGLQDILNMEEKKLLGDTYDRIVQELISKVEQKKEEKKLSISSEHTAQSLAA